VGLRVYTPAAHRPGRDAAGLRPLVLWFHGGGWVLGNVVNYDPLCGFLAHQVGAVVLSVDYRLAPEHPAPAAIHDCLDVTRWAWQHAPQVGADPARMAVAGDSAGGNLATVVAQLLRDDGGPQLRCQALVYPVVDSTCLRRSKIVHSTGPILTRREADTFLAMYLGTGPDALTARDPLISPLLGRLEGLPPTLIQTAGLDPLHDEGLAYAEALRAAGVEVRATDYPLAPHGFASFPGASKGAWPHRSELAGHLRARLAG
jgi:acetyl esterase